MTWRNTKEYRHWRLAVIRRDKVCQCCGTRKGRHAHHINHSTYFPELRFEVTNGITLCGKCHMQFHNNFMGNTRMKCTDYHLDNFMELIEYVKGLGMCDDCGKPCDNDMICDDCLEGMR